MSGDARDFNIETRAVKSPPARQGAEGNTRHSDRNIRRSCTIVCHRQKLKNWVVQFKRDFSTCDVPRPGRPKTVTTPEIIDQIHGLILEDRWISAKSIVEQLGISLLAWLNIVQDYTTRIFLGTRLKFFLSRIWYCSSLNSINCSEARHWERMWLWGGYIM